MKHSLHPFFISSYYYRQVRFAGCFYRGILSLSG